MNEFIVFRRALRRVLPFPVRWRVRATRRRLDDVRLGVRFAERSGDSAEFAHLVCSYDRPLNWYPGQESRFAAKRHNIEFALSRVDRLIVAAGETFSFWRSVGRPTVRAGYERAAALKDGVLVDDVGGAICLASTLVYNIGLLSGMTVNERWCHSVDSYGDARYFELGRDSAVEYAYRDLRMRNELAAPLMLRTYVGNDIVRAEARCPVALDLRVEINVNPRESDGRHISVSTVRHVIRDEKSERNDLGVSTYRLASANRELPTTN